MQNCLRWCKPIVSISVKGLHTHEKIRIKLAGMVNTLSILNLPISLFQCMQLAFFIEFLDVVWHHFCYGCKNYNDTENAGWLVGWLLL